MQKLLLLLIWSYSLLVLLLLLLLPLFGGEKLQKPPIGGRTRLNGFTTPVWIASDILPSSLRFAAQTCKNSLMLLPLHNCVGHPFATLFKFIGLPFPDTGGNKKAVSILCNILKLCNLYF